MDEENVYSGMGFMFEEDTKVEEDIKREVEDIKMKLRVEKLRKSTLS